MKQYFDDGSTYDGDTGQATQSPPGALITDYYRNFEPGNASSGATTWADVLKYGFGRVVDYKTASLAPANATPNYAPPGRVNQPQADTFSGSGLLIVGALILAFVLASGD